MARRVKIRSGPALGRSAAPRAGARLHVGFLRRNRSHVPPMRRGPHIAGWWSALRLMAGARRGRAAQQQALPTRQIPGRLLDASSYDGQAETRYHAARVVAIRHAAAPRSATAARRSTPRPPSVLLDYRPPAGCHPARRSNEAGRLLFVGRSVPGIGCIA